jgi:hypothetical protein
MSALRANSGRSMRRIHTPAITRPVHPKMQSAKQLLHRLCLRRCGADQPPICQLL